MNNRKSLPENLQFLVGKGKKKVFLKLLIYSEKDGQPVILLFHSEPKLADLKKGLVYCTKVMPGQNPREVIRKELKQLTSSDEHQISDVRPDGTEKDRQGQTIERWSFCLHVPCFDTENKRFAGLNNSYMSWIKEKDLGETNLARRDDQHDRLVQILRTLEKGELGPIETDLTDYSLMLIDLADVSRGVFQPEHIREKINPDGSVKLSFEAHGRTYRINLPRVEKFHRELINLVNRILEESGGKERIHIHKDDRDFETIFYGTPDEDQDFQKSNSDPNENEMIN